MVSFFLFLRSGITLVAGHYHSITVFFRAGARGFLAALSLFGVWIALPQSQRAACGHGQPASILSRKRSPLFSQICERGPNGETGAPVGEICKREEAAAAAAAAALLPQVCTVCAFWTSKADGRTRPHEHLENLANAEPFSLSPSLSDVDVWPTAAAAPPSPRRAYVSSDTYGWPCLHNVKLCYGWGKLPFARICSNFGGGGGKRATRSAVSGNAPSFEGI